ncbi:MAG: glucosaminidase domain-containing protein [Lewinellaceae bacterium]|nr:glucosaminidase domain-containing protein [Lewinellaceae bacterium]
MGKMKWYAASEDNMPQPGIRSTNQNRQHQHRAKPPGRFFQQQPEVPSLRYLLRQILLRWRRNWIAFRFQANRYTLGLFQKQTALKLGTLAALSYVLLFSDREFWFATGTGSTETVWIGPVETSLEVDEKPRGRSLIREIEPAAPQKRVPKRPVEHNDAAPVGVRQIGKGNADRYIARYANIAVQEMKKFGVPASISLAQGLVESRFGTSTLAVRNNNHFGMKCFLKNCRPGHCSNHSDDHHKDFFRKYKNPWESWRAHSQMLARGRYAKLKKHGKNYRAWARGLEQLGYATDPSYSEKLIGVIERYNLQRFDR